MKNSLSSKDTQVTIGECRIPLSMLYINEHKKHNCLEFVLTAKLRKSQTVGTIKAIIAFSNNKFDSLSEALKLSMSEHKEKDCDSSLDLEAIVNN